MAMSDPFEQANEADVAEQAQDVDGSGSLTEPEYSRAEADEADVLDQGADFAGDEETDEAYPHADNAE